MDVFVNESTVTVVLKEHSFRSTLDSFTGSFLAQELDSPRPKA